MQDDFSGYREELDRMRLTEESKRALVSALASHGQSAGQRPPRHLAGAVRLALIAAAVIGLLATAGYAAVNAAPTLLGRVFTDDAGYEQSSALIGKAVDNNGWTVTITDCVGDDKELYMGLELTAPEGTVLNEKSYCFGDNDFILKFFDRQGGQGRSMYQLPDEDPADNKLAFVIHMDSLFAVLNGSQIRLVLPELRYSVWSEAEKKVVHIPVCKGKWDFGVMTIAYPDSTVRLRPNLPVTTLGVDATITQLEVSPLSIFVRIEGSALKGHHSWVPRNAPDGWYGCIEYQEIVLHFDDGTAFIVDQVDSNIGGSGCSGGTDTSEDGWLMLRRTYSRNINGVSNKLIDVDRVTSVSVCGVEIPLR